MSDEPSVPTGQVSATPEGGPPDEGVPATAPGAGQVWPTPEGGPPAQDEMLVPPTWSEHMQGPILGLDDVPAQPAASTASTLGTPPAAAREERAGAAEGAREDFVAPSESSARGGQKLKKWPPYTGKPVSDVSEAFRYAAPVVAQAEKLTIQAIGFSGRGLSRLARYLEARRAARQERGERTD